MFKQFSTLLLNLKKFAVGHKKEVVFFLCLITIASVLRLYNIRNTIVFLGDEGRDALAVKRIVLDLDPTFLGPTASVGGFYLGPVYYYMIAPFMVLFGMDPVGAAVFVALLGITTVGVLYCFVRYSFGIFPAGIISILYAVAPGVNRFSRSSWNPNPMPFFSLVTLISFYMAVKTSKNRWLFIVGILLGIVIQLHYLGLIIIGSIGLMTLIMISKKDWIKSIATEFGGFLVGSWMFFAFEFRHGFLNSRAVFEFITRRGGAAGPRSWNPLWLYLEVNRFNIEGILGLWSKEATIWITLTLLTLLVVVLVYKKRKGISLNLVEKTLLLYWVITTIAFGFYKGQLYYHYFELLFPLPFLLLGFILNEVRRKSIQVGVAIVVTCVSVLMVAKSPALEKGSKLLDQTQRVSQAVNDFSGEEPFNFALITEGNSDHAYRYFLEIENKVPTPLEEKIEGQLIVVCEKWPEEICAPLGNPLWEVAGFGRAEIVDQIEVYPRITVYKLQHYSENEK